MKRYPEKIKLKNLVARALLKREAGKMSKLNLPFFSFWDGERIVKGILK